MKLCDSATGLRIEHSFKEVGMEDVESRKKDRSPNFPFISLEAALDRARAFYEEERRGAAPVARVAKHWRCSPSSSGLLQTVAALKSYGLVGDEGSGADRRLRLTDAALRILLDTRPDSPERAELIKRAALSPSISTEVHGNWPDGLPSEDTLSHYLIFERGFSPQNAARAVKILKENQRLASLDQVDPLSLCLTDGGDAGGQLVAVDVARAPDWESPDPRQSASPPMNSVAKFGGGSPAVHAGAHAAALALPFTEQILDPDGRAIRIEFSAAPTEEMYEFLKDYIDLRLRAIRRRAMAVPSTALHMPARVGGEAENS